MEKKETRTEAPGPGPVYVVGHRNPDTDSVASAIGYAWLLGERDKIDARPVRAGRITPQTAFALKTFDIPAPPVLTDASARFAHVMRKVPSLSPDKPLAKACVMIAENGRAAPIVDADGKPAGLILASSIFDFLTRKVAGIGGKRPVSRARTPIGDVLAVPCGNAVVADIPAFEAGARIKDVLHRVLRGERDTFFVVDGQGRYLGLCWKVDLLRPPRMRVILIDHNEPGQSISGLDEADLLEVLDHHRLANPTTHNPIAFHVDPVGSSSTLVTERAMRSGLAVPRGVAGVLLSGVLSDTLLLKSPTTTGRDRVAAVQLAGWAFPEAADPYKAMIDYGWELLRAGAELASRTIESIVSGDYKEYEAGQVRFGVAQVEVTDMREIEARLDETRMALAALEKGSRLEFAALLVTDIINVRSRLLTSGRTPVLDALPYTKLDDGTYDLPGVVSRKKQLIPVMLGILQD